MTSKKHKAGVYLNPREHELLLAYCEKTGLSQSKAVELMMIKVFELIYSQDGTLIDEVDNLTTENKITALMTENNPTDLSSLEFLLKHAITALEDVKHQTRDSARLVREVETYNKEIKSFRVDLLAFSTHAHNFMNEVQSFRQLLSFEISARLHDIERNLQGFFSLGIDQQKTAILSHLEQILIPIRDSLQRLSQVFRV